MNYYNVHEFRIKLIASHCNMSNKLGLSSDAELHIIYKLNNIRV